MNGGRFSPSDDSSSFLHPTQTRYDDTELVIPSSSLPFLAPLSPLTRRDFVPLHDSMHAPASAEDNCTHLKLFVEGGGMRCIIDNKGQLEIGVDRRQRKQLGGWVGGKRGLEVGGGAWCVR